MVSDAELAEIDTFLAEAKTLSGAPPKWGQHYGRDWTIRWGILDELGIQRGELSFTYDARLERPSVCVLSQRRLTYRLDLVPEAECEENPYGARALGLPKRVCGSHEHAWDVNREWVRLNGFGALPFRRATPKALRTLSQMLAAVADAANLELTSDQRDLRPPAQPDMF